MSSGSRRRALEIAGLVHPHPGSVTAAVFAANNEFFFADDRVQVKYEMLRAHYVDRVSVTAAADAHGYSRAAFYLISGSFAEIGMTGLLNEHRGRRGPIKLTEEIVAFIAAADSDRSGAEVADAVFKRFGVALHRRTVERAR